MVEDKDEDKDMSISAFHFFGNEIRALTYGRVNGALVKSIGSKVKLLTCILLFLSSVIWMSYFMYLSPSSSLCEIQQPILHGNHLGKIKIDNPEKSNE